jgi:hypothetical protein
MTVRNPKLRFKPAMRWEGPIEEFVISRSQGYVLNAPCGASMIGDVRMDSDTANRMATCFGDVHDLRDLFGDDAFDTVVSDPPWHLNIFQRPKMFFPLVEVCKIGGRIIYNAPWIPESKYAELEEIWIRQSAAFSNASILSVFKKTGAVP